MSICSLNKDSTYCLNKDDLIKIQDVALDTNYSSPDKIIKELEKKTPCDSIDDPQQKGLCMIEKIKSDVDDEKTKLLLDNIQLIRFKPVTKNFSHDHWLNNTEIDHIQHQLASAHPGYYYSYIVMIDLEHVEPKHNDKLKYDVPAITDINFVNELKKENNVFVHNGEFTKYGLVVNTDTSDGPGIHWFSIFMDFTKVPYTIEYFNSSGLDIRNDKFKKFFMNLADEITKEITPCKFIKVTDIQHQGEDTANCGSYALYYIKKRLKGKPYEFFAKNKVTDEKVRKFREKLFRIETTFE